MENKSYNSKSKFFYNVLEQYKLTSDFNSSRIRQDLTKEQSTRKDYMGREIYELIQNAEDEKSEYVRIDLDTNNRIMTIANAGKLAKAFTEAGYCSIMMAEMSPKMASGKSYIGNKGLGFRSLINWAEEISIVSGGVKCTFSHAIAKEYWVKLKESWKNSPDYEELAKQHEEFALRQFNLDNPLPMLAIPKVEECNSNDYITKIIIRYNSNCQHSIEKQLSSISGKVLLFLNNIRKIDIHVAGQPLRSIYQESDCIVTDNIKETVTYDDNHPRGQRWIVYKESGDIQNDQKYEIGLAFDPLEHESGKYMYTYFPTRVRIGLPLVIHATFELNSSRNAINESDVNIEIQRLLGQTVIRFAQYLSGIHQGEPSWIYHDITTITDHYDRDEFKTFSSTLEYQRNSAHIFPAISGKFMPLADTVHFSEALAKFLQCQSLLSQHRIENHLIPGYASRSIVDQPCNGQLTKYANDLSQWLEQNRREDVKLRANFIGALAEVTQCSKFKILTDESGRLIDHDAKINVGESILYLPTEMNVRYVSNILVEALKEQFSITDSAYQRAITRKLRQNSCADVSDMDVNALKHTIVRFTKQGMDSKSFEQLMFALFMKMRNDSHNHDYANVFSHHDFRVLDSTGTKRYPSEVVLKTDKTPNIYQPQYLLYKTLSEWTELLSGKSGIRLPEDEIYDFFINIVGVSTYIPKDYIALEDNANTFINENCVRFKVEPWQIWRYYSSNFNGEFTHVNWFYVAKYNFLKELLNRNLTLADIIMLLKEDKKLMSELRNRNISYTFHGHKHDEFEIGYALFLTRQYDIFEPLRYYVVSENMSLNADIYLETQLNRLTADHDAASLMIMLGGKEQLSNLGYKELYDIMRALPTKKLNKGIQKIYRSIREAILSKSNRPENDEIFRLESQKFAESGLVYAKKDGSKPTIVPIHDVYYWDNDQLPQQMLQSMWKLEIGNRVGENSVKKIFGVKLAAEVEVTICECKKNDRLTKDVLDNIHERFRYILASRFHNSRDIKRENKPLIAKALKNIRINIYNLCEYICGDRRLDMKENDMITQTDDKGVVFHLCSSHSSYQNAIKSPKFCESLMETLTILMKVTGSEMSNSFRSILKNSKEENRYIFGKEISMEEWEDVDIALGLSREEQDFWVKVSELKGKHINIDVLCKDNQCKRSYLLSVFPGIELPEDSFDLRTLSPTQKYRLLESLGIEDATVLGNSGLYDFYLKQIENLRSEVRNSFIHSLFEKISEDDSHLDKPNTFYYECQSFDDNWPEELAKKLTPILYTDADIKKQFYEFVFVKFNVSFSELSLEDNWKPMPLKSYIDIIKEYNIEDISIIDPRDLAVSCFKGYEDIFRERLKKYLDDNSDLNIYASDDFETSSSKVSPVIHFGEWKNVVHVQDNSLSPHHSVNGGYQSNRVKAKAGRIAEKKVFDAMHRDSKRFALVKGCSRNLDPINGLDHLHYDITYCPVKDGVICTQRFLEVKSMSSNSIIITQGEYAFAKSNAQLYDMAIVHGDEITFLISPFSETDGKPTLEVIPDTFKIQLEIKNAD